MKNKITDSSLYEKVNQAVPKNSPTFHRTLLDISQQPQQISKQDNPFKIVSFSQLGMVATTISFIFLFSLHIMIGDIKSISAEKDLQLELSQVFLNPSAELLFSELTENFSEKPINQLIDNTN